MKKPVASGSGARASSAAQFMYDERVRFPTLVQYLNDTSWDDGAVRETSTLMLLVEDGFLKACLNDRAMGRSLWVAADGVDAALAALESHLAAGTGDWRVKKPFSPGGRKK